MEIIKETQTSNNTNTAPSYQTNAIPTQNATVVNESVQATAVRTRKSEGEWFSSVVWIIFGGLLVLLAIRVIFLLLAAQASGFAAFIYALSAPFVSPFQGIFPAPAAGGSYFDTAAILAMVMYTVIAWGISSIINLMLERKNTTSL